MYYITLKLVIFIQDYLCIWNSMAIYNIKKYNVTEQIIVLGIFLEFIMLFFVSYLKCFLMYDYVKDSIFNSDKSCDIYREKIYFFLDNYYYTCQENYNISQI